MDRLRSKTVIHKLPDALPARPETGTGSPQVMLALTTLSKDCKFLLVTGVFCQ